MNQLSIDSIRSLDDFIESLRTHQATLHHWFRGQTDGDASLRPGALRRSVNGSAPSLGIERILIQEFRRRAGSLLPPNAKRGELYVLAQHFGLATRLLDWTRDPLTALYFAVDNEPYKDGAVFIWNPSLAKLRFTDGRPDRHVYVPVRVDSDEVSEVFGPLFGDATTVAVDQPFGTFPDLSAGRVGQQNSCFSLHPPGGREDLNHEAIRLPIRSSDKERLKDSLRWAGVVESRLFPDLDHIAKGIMAEHWIGT